MSSGHFRAAPYSFVFDGQSLNQFPFQPNNYPTQMMAALGTIDGLEPPWSIVAEGAASWSELAAGVYRPTAGVSVAPAVDRLFIHANQGLTTFLLMCGGTQDVLEGDTAATIYGDMESYADNAKAAGFTYVIAQTIATSTAFSGGEETVRDAANVLILADAGGAFDATVNIDVAPLDDPADTDYYSDGIHPTALGATVLADVTLAAVESLL